MSEKMYNGIIKYHGTNRDTASLYDKNKIDIEGFMDELTKLRKDNKIISFAFIECGRSHSDLLKILEGGNNE